MSATSPYISVIVPVYNAARYLRQCCKALLSQSYSRERYELLLVDNNSSDDSARIVEEFGIDLLRETEQGSYAARNLALREAKGELLAFTDPDCVPRPDWLARIASSLHDPAIQIVLGEREFAISSGALGRLEAYETAMAARVHELGRAEHIYAYTNNMAIRRGVFEQLGPFEQIERGGDSRFLHRAMRAMGGPSIVRYDPQVIVRHLEIDSVSGYLEKKYTYGRVSGSHQDGPADFPVGLPFHERMGLAKAVIRNQPARTALAFAAVLAAGSLLFEWSRLRTAGRK